MADPNWRTGGEDAFEESDAIKKLLKQIEELTARFQENSKMTNQQTSQLYKLIKSTESKLRIEDDHFKKRTLTIEQNRKAALDKITESGKQVRLNKLLANAMKQQLETYDSVKNSLLRPKGLKSSIVGVVDSLAHMTRTTKELEKAQKALSKKQKDDPAGDHKTETELVNTLTDMKKLQTFGNGHLDRLAKRFAKLADKLEKHRGKILIGAGVASILIGIISKALNVAPLFQAMMKLMQFAFTMILMPVGTFFGSILKPIIIGLVKKIAPQFGEWMENSMKVGDAIGNLLASIGGGLFDTLVIAIEKIAAFMGVNSIGDVGEWAVKNPEIATVATAAIGLTGYKVADTVLNKVVNRANSKYLESRGISNNQMGNWGESPFKDKSSNSPLGKLDKTTQKGFKGWNTTLKDFAKRLGKSGNLKGNIGVGAILAILGMNPTANAFQAWAIGESNMVGMDQKERDDYLHEKYARGVSADGIGIGDADYSNENPFAHNTKTLEEINAYLDSDIFKSVDDSLSQTETMAQKFDDVVTMMGSEAAPSMDSEMTQLMNHFMFMKKMSGDSAKAAAAVAENFELANETIKAKIDKWVNRINTSETATSGDKRSANTAQQAWNDKYEVATSMFGGANYKNPWTVADNAKNSLERVSESALAKAAADAIKKYNRDNAGGNSGTYEDLYNGIPTQGDTYYSTQRSDEAKAELNKKHGMTRAQMENTLSFPTLSTGGVDWNTKLANMANSTRAVGGWINEPVKGIGMNTGQTYSIGERGAEYVSPNGGGSGGGITINIAKIERTADFNQLKPMIQRWILEANSRRGMI